MRVVNRKDDIKVTGAQMLCVGHQPPDLGHYLARHYLARLQWAFLQLA